MDRHVKGILIAVVILACVVSPIGVIVFNNMDYVAHKADDITNYNTRKQVEDTCRSYIVSYESDRLMYEQYKDSTDKEQLSWANNAKIRANKTAFAYNEYILKNDYVFKDNVPADIRTQLEIIE